MINVYFGWIALTPRRDFRDGDFVQVRDDGAVRFLFSKRNVFLLTRTRVEFQLEPKLRLIPATDTPVHILPVNAGSQK